VSCDGARVRRKTTTLRSISLAACRLISCVSRNTSGTHTLAGTSFRLIPCWAKTAGARSPCCATVCCGIASSRITSLRRILEVSCDGARVRRKTTTLRSISLAARSCIDEGAATCATVDRASVNTSGTHTLAAGSSFQRLPCFAKTAGGARCPCCATVCCGIASSRNTSLRRIPEVSCDGARVRRKTTTLRSISLAACRLISCVSRNTSGTHTLAGTSFRLIPCWAKTAGARSPCCATVCCGIASSRITSLRRILEVSCDGARVRSLTTLRSISLAALTYISCWCCAILCAAISWYVTGKGT